MNRLQNAFSFDPCRMEHPTALRQSIKVGGAAWAAMGAKPPVGPYRDIPLTRISFVYLFSFLLINRDTLLMRIIYIHVYNQR